MSKNKPKKKVVTPSSEVKKKVVAPTVSRRARTSAATAAPSEPLLFKKINYIYMAAGFGLMLLGFILMLGGDMPDPTKWDDNVIYSPVRMIIAPILILAGLVVEIMAIFKK